MNVKFGTLADIIFRFSRKKYIYYKEKRETLVKGSNGAGLRVLISV